ncbi:MAG: carbohydrate binding family 9 domain-containing protein [Longimicrobiales bacterium]
MLKRAATALLASSVAFASGIAAQQKPQSTVLPVLTVRKSADGRPEVLAAPSRAPVKIDGLLDDEVWAQAQVFGGFTQSEPLEGQPASYATEVRVAYDAENLYVAAYCRDGGQRVVNDIRKDFRPDDQDTFELILDTFADRRNGYAFITNPEGARTDQQIANEGREVNASWDAIWSVKTARVPDGWTVEMAIPFRSLRFAPGATTWGINFSRRLRSARACSWTRYCSSIRARSSSTPMCGSTSSTTHSATSISSTMRRA